ncbi:Pkinase-domain-containing protein, partial [Rhizoclosmatium globosum]
MIPGKGRGNRPPPPPPPGYFGPPGTGPGSSSSYPAFVPGSSAIGTPPNQRVGFGGPPPPPPPLPHPLPLPLPLPPHQQQQQQPQSPFAQSHPHPQFRNQPQHQHQHQLDQTRAPHLPHQHQQHQQHTPRLSHNQHSSKHSHSDLIVTPTQSSLPPSDPIDPALAFRPAVFTSVESLYDKTAMVGEGTYGKVYKAVNKKTKETVALKRVRIETEKEGFPITGVREIKILTSLRHDNVVRLLEIISEETGNACFVHLVFEYMDHDLTGIFNNAQLQWEQKHIKCLMKQLFEGLAYLHDKGIIHRDMKGGSNLLLNNQGILKLADFGLARYMTVPKIEYTNRVITLWYRPPELLLGSTSYTTEIDLWSSGCIMAEMYIRRPLFPGNDEISQLDHIWKTCGVPTEESWPKVSEMPWWNFMRPSKQYPRVLGDNMQRHMIGEALTLLESLLQLDPILRPSAREVLQHLYFYEEPLPCMPYELPKVEGDWHEYESKLRKKGKHPEQVQDG